MEKVRNSTIDTLRFVAIFIIVLIHTDVFQYSSETYSSHIFKVLYNFIQSLRISVPFFFVIAGYFFGKKLLAGEPPLQLFKRSFRRLFSVFSWWCIIYLVIPWDWIELFLKYGVVRPVYWHMEDTLKVIMNKPFTLIMEGTRIHLWFLPSLIMAFGIMTGFIAAKKEKYLIPFAAVIYVFGLLGTSYKWLLPGIAMPFVTGYGPFRSTLLVSLGWWVARRKKFFPHEGLIFLLTGVVTMSAEIHFLCRYHGLTAPNYLLGIIPISLGLLILALTYPGVGRSTIFPQWGATFTLGVYVSHVLIMDNLSFFRSFFEPISWDLFYPVVIYLGTLFAVMLFKRNTITHGLVS